MSIYLAHMDDPIFYGQWTNLHDRSQIGPKPWVILLNNAGLFVRSRNGLKLVISYIHHTCEVKQYCHVGNTAKQYREGLFQDSDFAGDPEDSESTSGGILCIFGSHTFVPVNWMCKKQTSGSHSSTEAEMICLDAGLRMDGIPAFDLWDLAIDVCHLSPNQTNKTKYVREPQ